MKSNVCKIFWVLGIYILGHCMSNKTIKSQAYFLGFWKNIRSIWKQISIAWGIYCVKYSNFSSKLLISIFKLLVLFRIFDVGNSWKKFLYRAKIFRICKTFDFRKKCGNKILQISPKWHVSGGIQTCNLLDECILYIQTLFIIDSIKYNDMV